MHGGTSSLARWALFLQTIAFVHNFGELPIRRPNRAPPAATKDGPRTNDEIRNAQVQLIDQNGTNHGTVETMGAIKMALEAGMDLVEISPNTNPPVCKIMDYGKFKYSAQKKAAEARKKQKIVEIKEIKLRPMIDDHDYDVKMRAMQRFFEEGDKVKITLRYRGREMAHQEIGTKLLDKVKADVAEFAKVEQDARFEGRQVVMVLAPRWFRTLVSLVNETGPSDHLAGHFSRFIVANPAGLCHKRSLIARLIKGCRGDASAGCFG
jgi:translation initiation factor IF-3